MSSPERLLRYMGGFAPPLVIQAALRHKIFDALSKAPMTAAEVSAATGKSIRGLMSLMKALVSLELLAKDGDIYTLTAESAAYLVSGTPDYLGDVLDDIDSALFPIHYQAATAAAEVLGVADATSLVRVLDLAGGAGVWGIAIARKSPHVTVTSTGGCEIAILAETTEVQLKQAFDALNAGGTLVITEFDQDAWGEIKTQLEVAGFVRAGLVPIPNSQPLIFADKP